MTLHLLAPMSILRHNTYNISRESHVRINESNKKTKKNLVLTLYSSFCRPNINLCHNVFVSCVKFSLALKYEHMVWIITNMAL